MQHLKSVSPVGEQVVCTYCIHVAVGFRDTLMIDEWAECPSIGGPELAETDVAIGHQVIRHWREDAV